MLWSISKLSYDLFISFILYFIYNNCNAVSKIVIFIIAVMIINAFIKKYVSILILGEDMSIKYIVF